MEKKAIVLLITETAETAKRLIAELEPLHLDFVTVNDEKSGFDFVQSDRVDLVLAELTKSNFECLRVSRKEGFRTPFVFLIHTGNEDLMVRALALRSVDCVEKSYQPKQLLEVVRNASQIGSTMRSLDFRLTQLCETAGIGKERGRELTRLQQRAVEAMMEGRMPLKKIA